MGHKSFKRAANLEPIWFTLGESETRFDCEDDIPGGMVLDFSDAMDGSNKDADLFGAIKGFFNAAVIESQQELFWKVVYDKAERVGLSVLMELAQWLGGEYADRPTGPSSADTSPKTSTGGDSTAGALRGVPMYSRPEPVAATT